MLSCNFTVNKIIIFLLCLLDVSSRTFIGFSQFRSNVKWVLLVTIYKILSIFIIIVIVIIFLLIAILYFYLNFENNYFID
jgi:hypothetical protein